MSKAQNEMIGRLAAILHRIHSTYQLDARDHREILAAVREAEAMAPAPVGRPATIDVQQAREMAAAGKTHREIAEKMGVTRPAVSMALKVAERDGFRDASRCVGAIDL